MEVGVDGVPFGGEVGGVAEVGTVLFVVAEALFEDGDDFGG